MWLRTLLLQVTLLLRLKIFRDLNKKKAYRCSDRPLVGFFTRYYSYLSVNDGRVLAALKARLATVSQVIVATLKAAKA